MSKMDFSALVADMLAAARAKLVDHWKDARPYAESEFQAYTRNLAFIANLKEDGKITEEQAKLYLDIQKNSMRTVLLTIEGLGILAVEAALNAALDVIRTVVNKAIGWALL